MKIIYQNQQLFYIYWIYRLETGFMSTITLRNSREDQHIIISATNHLSLKVQQKC